MIKALTVKQPYAQLIVDGIKDVENRTWPTIRRGKILIHAGMSKENSSKDVSSFISKQQFDSLTQSSQWMLTQGIWTLGSILGEVEIVDCVKASKSIWALPAHYHWTLANPVRYDKPILNVKGGLSFWNYTGHELEINL